MNMEEAALGRVDAARAANRVSFTSSFCAKLSLIRREDSYNTHASTSATSAWYVELIACSNTATAPASSTHHSVFASPPPLWYSSVPSWYWQNHHVVAKRCKRSRMPCGTPVLC